MTTITAEVVADSVSQEGVRLTTMQLVYPRFLLAQLNTHRSFARSTASHRAIPSSKLIERIKKDPYIPIYWGKNQRGMVAPEELPKATQYLAREEWLAAMTDAIAHAERLRELGVHKQTANRILEPFLHASTVITGTDWENFFGLRTPEDAQPEIQALAWVMAEALYEPKAPPQELREWQWHLPYVRTGEFYMSDPEQLVLAQKCSVARCARVSYLNHDNTNSDVTNDVRLYDQLIANGHVSPAEHQARPASQPFYRSGNLRGWIQYRKELSNELRKFDYAKAKEARKRM
jgi:thymidylate synthase ThyX